MVRDTYATAKVMHCAASTGALVRMYLGKKLYIKNFMFKMKVKRETYNSAMSKAK